MIEGKLQYFDVTADEGGIVLTADTGMNGSTDPKQDEVMKSFYISWNSMTGITGQGWQLTPTIPLVMSGVNKEDMASVNAAISLGYSKLNSDQKVDVIYYLGKTAHCLTMT